MGESEMLADELWSAVENNNADKVKSLLQQGVDPNNLLYEIEERWIKIDGVSQICPPPLHLACLKGNLEIIKMLVKGGADIDKKGDEAYNWTPLHYACNTYQKESVMYLVEEAGCKVGVRDNQGKSPLDLVLYNDILYVCSSSVDIACYLINCGCGNDEDKIKLLCQASELGKLDVVKEMIEQHNVDPNGVIDENGQTPLERAWVNALYGEHRIGIAVVLYLINHSCDNNWRKVELLCLACDWGMLDVVRELVEQHKVNPNGVSNDSGQSPLDRALNCACGSKPSTGVDIALYLINHGCGDDKSKLKLLCLACNWRKLDVVKELVEQHKVNPNGMKNNQAPPLLVFDKKDCVDIALYLIKHGYGGNNEKVKLLCKACEWDKLDVVKELVEQHKVDAKNVRDKDDKTPLHWAFKGESTKVIPYLVEELQCDIGARDNLGRSLLSKTLNDKQSGNFSLALKLVTHRSSTYEDKVQLLCLASELGKLDVVRELVEQHNVDPNEIEKNLRLAFICDKEDCVDVALYLINHGCGGDEEKVKLLYKAYEWDKLDVVKELIEKLDLEPTGMQHDWRQPLLDEALDSIEYKVSSVHVALYLINHGCGGNEDKVALLCGACSLGELEVVKELVKQHKISPNDVRDKNNWTPLHCACGGGHKEVVYYLVKELQCEVDVTDDESRTPLDVAAKSSTDPLGTNALRKDCAAVVDYLKSLKQSSPHSAFPMFLKHPKNVKTKPGSSVTFPVEFFLAAKKYNWYFQLKTISSDETGYDGFATSTLKITKCLPKHKGAYKCVVTDESGETFTSESAALMIDGEKIKKNEAKLLGEILRKAGVSLMIYGVDVEQLAEGECDHTYEEIEYVLKDNPSTHVLSVNLKEELTSRLEEERLYKEAMANDHKVSLSYTKILALGPGQVGKSTFLYRLMGLMKGNIQTADPKTQPQCSTGVAELREACITYTSRTGALTSESWQVFDESSDIQCQLEGLMSLLVEQTPIKEHVESKQPLASDKLTRCDASSVPFKQQQNTNDDKYSDSKPKIQIQKNLARTVKVERTRAFPNSNALTRVHYHVPQLSNIDMVLAEFKSIQAACKLAPSKTKFRMLFNIADIGGQPAFLEMLPSLTIGPAFYLVFMKLLQGLTTQYPVAYKCKDGRGSKLCKNYTYTSEEVIFTALSSIACFGNSDEEVEQYVTNAGDKKQTNSLALLVGTFKDEMKDEKSLDDIDYELQQKLEVTDFFNDGLIQSKSFLRVDNYGAPEIEIEHHRKLLEEILDKKFHKFEIPTRWLTLSICLKLLARKENRHEVSFDDCVKLGSRLNINKEMVKVALQFLHKYIGLVMYFPRNSHLKNVVICDPQVVFSSISELIFDIYDPRKMYITEAQHDHFVLTGCFSPQDIKPIDKEPKKKKLLPIDTLVHLLAHLNIITEVPLTLGSQRDSHTMLQKKELIAAAEVVDASTVSKKYYFLPAVLQTAVLTPILRGANEEQLPEPLCIGFKTGYLPLGFTCALSANLIGTQSNLELIPFEVDNQQITYKNKMRFRFEGEFDILLIAGPKYCEFHVTRCSEGVTEYWECECCPRIKTIICEAANRVVQSMQHGSLYKLAKSYELAFTCPHHSEVEIGHEPLAKFVFEDSSSTLATLNQPKKILCTDSSCKISTPLSPAMKMWFGEAIQSTHPKITRESSIVDNKIKIQAEGTRPLKYQWFKDDEELCVSGSYEGATSSEHLVIVGTDPQLKGKYKCRVTNKLGETFSQEVLYDPFVRELMLKGLRSGEISKMIDNEIESLEDLESLTEDDIDLFKIKFGAKKRVMSLIFSLKQSSEDQTDQRVLTGASVDHKPLSGHPDFNILREILWDIRAKWYLLGIQLEIEHSDLEVFQKRSSVEDCFIAVLSHFLNCKCPLPTRSCLEAALQSPSVGREDLVQKIPSLLKAVSTSQQPQSDHSRTPAARLRRVVNTLWEERAQWERIAGPGILISAGTCQKILKDHPHNTDDCYAAFLHEHLKGDGDPSLQGLLEALRSEAVGRAAVADELEERIKKNELW